MTGPVRDLGGATVAPLAEADRVALRAEHDALIGKLSARRSVDLIRRASYGIFVGLLVAGLSVTLAWDRYLSGEPSRFRGSAGWWIASAVLAVALFVVSAAWAVRARKLMRVEDARFARVIALRRELELDP